MFFIFLLFLEFLLFPLLNLEIRFPSLFSVENNVSFGIHTVWNFRQTVVSTVRAKFYLVFINVILLPTKVTFPDESTNGWDFPGIKREKFYSHVSTYVLDGKICTNKSDLKLLLSLLIFDYYLAFLGFFYLKIWRINFCHLFIVIFWSYPSLFVFNIAVLLLGLFLFISRNLYPFLFIL